MRKVKVVRRPVMLRVGSLPLPASPARTALGTVDDMPAIAKARAGVETLDDDDPPTTIATDLEVATITSELDDDGPLIATTNELPAIARPRTSTSTVSAAARLAALKRTRSPR